MMNIIKTGMTASAANSAPLRPTDFALSFMRVSLLEDCIAACEFLAEELGADDHYDPLQQQLSECVSICELYLGATVRESRYRIRYGLMCAEICAETARSCQGIRGDVARDCQVLCRACVKLIGNEFQTVLSN